MLIRPQAGRLCSRCRSDFLSLFEHGFPDPQSTARRHVFNVARRPQSRPQRRAFTASVTRLHKNPTHPADHTTKQNEARAPEEDSFDREQLAALKACEKILGRPIGDGIEETQLRALVTEAEQKIEHEEDLPATTELEAAPIGPSDASIVALRQEGASPADVAREARQVFGEHLPDGILQVNENRIYRRMYGEPLVEVEEDAVEDDVEIERDDLSRGELVDERGKPIANIARDLSTTNNAAGESAETLENTLETRAMTLAEILDAEYAEQEAYIQDDEDIPSFERAHPMTALGRAGTRPSTVSLPKAAYGEPLQNILANYSNKQLKDTCERTFGGPGLPDSPLTPRNARSRKQVPIPLQASQIFMGEMEANAFLTSVMPPAYAAITSVLTETRKRLGQTWLTELLAREGGPRVLDAGAGGAGILAWNEITRAHWESLHSSNTGPPPPPPPSKTVVLTGSDPLRHRSASVLENTTFIPRLPDYVHARDKPTLDDDRSTQQRKQFDVIISSYSLLPFKEDWEKKMYVQNLWTLLSSTGGVLILLEKGMPRGFEAIAGARDLLLQRYIATPTGHATHYTMKHHNDEDSVHKPLPGMIVAPCTNHEKCPMYGIPGESRGRKDFCSFQQRYIRPPELQRILGARDRNHDDVDFSYISVVKGRDLRTHQFSNWNDLSDPFSSKQSSSGAQAQSQSNTETWMQSCKTGFAATTPDAVADTSGLANGLTPTHLLPRMVFPPIKRQGHILLDLCTPKGSLERWTVPKSFSKQAFRDARKAQWGDIWALGAKTRIPRKVRLGAESKENRTSRNKDERRRSKALETMDKLEKKREARHLEQEDFEQDLVEWEGDEGFGEDEEITEDINNQVWQDIGVGQVEQLPKRTRDVRDNSKTVSPPTSPMSPEAEDDSRHGFQDAEDIATRQMMAEWEAELEVKVPGNNKKVPLGRATKNSTRKTKRKYRESKRNGTLDRMNHVGQ